MCLAVPANPVIIIIITGIDVGALSLRLQQDYKTHCTRSKTKLAGTRGSFAIKRMKNVLKLNLHENKLHK